MFEKCASFDTAVEMDVREFSGAGSFSATSVPAPPSLDSLHDRLTKIEEKLKATEPRFTVRSGIAHQDDFTLRDLTK